MDRVMLLDSDIVAYKFAFKSQKTYAFEDEEGNVGATVIEELEDVLPRVDLWIQSTMEIIGASEVIVCLTHEENFRKEIYPAYKANRQGVEKPALLTQIKGYLASNYASYIRPGLEADDVMGILATSKSILKGKTSVIVSEDKDMKQIPGFLFNPAKDDEPRWIIESAAEYYFYTQVLTGDATDGYPGCPGIGPKKAERILDECDEYWPAIVEAYEAKGLTEEDALVQARCARILQACDYHFLKRRPKLWVPPKSTGRT